MLEQHVASGAGVTFSCVPVPLESAGSFGIVGVNADGGVNSFIEKPAPASLEPTGTRTVLASMGIYVFSTDYLIELLNRDALAASLPRLRQGHPADSSSRRPRRRPPVHRCRW